LHEEKAIFTGESWKDNELYSSLNNQVALNAVSQRNILMGNQISVLQEFSDLASVSSACKGIIGSVEQTAMILPGSIPNAQLPANRRPSLSGPTMIEALWEYKNGSDNDQVRLFFAPTLVYMKGRLLPEGHLDIREDDFSVRLLSSNASGHSKVYKDKELRKLAFKDFAGFGIHVSTKFDKSRLKEVLSILESHGIKLFADVDDKTWVNDYIQASIDIRDRAVADMVYESRLGVPEFDIIPLIERDSDELLLLAADPSAPYVSAEPENISPVAEVWDSNNEMDLFGDIDDYVIKQVDSRSKR
jgi:hypothetical protein